MKRKTTFMLDPQSEGTEYTILPESTYTLTEVIKWLEIEWNADVTYELDDFDYKRIFIMVPPPQIGTD